MNFRGFALSSCSLGRCLLVLGWIPLGTTALASVDSPPIFPDPLYSTDKGPISVAVADFNGDHVLDLATANSFPADSISILLAREDGGFGPEQRVPVGGSPSSLAAADLNGDGKSDLVVTDVAHRVVVVFLGSGDGSFIMDVPYPVGDFPRFVAIADLNLDAVPDLAVANMNTKDVSVLIGVGDGTFHPEHRFPAGGDAFSLVVTDFDQDGFPDLAVASWIEAVLLFGQGDGAFDPPISLGVGGNKGEVSICAADFNLDGHPDLAVGNSYTNVVMVLLGDGTGGIQARVANAPTAAVDWLGAADFDGNGVPDVATRTGSLPGHTDGSLGPAVPFAAVLAAGAIVDLDADGHPDLVGANDSFPGGVFILYNDGQGQMGVRSYQVPSNAVVAEDFNGDNFTDIAASSPYEEVSLLLGKGDGTFAPETRVPATTLISGFAAGDFDGDGRVDLVVLPHSGGVSLLRGTGDGGFQPAVNTTTRISPTFLTVGEFNGDGRADLVGGSGYQELLVLLGRADGTFEVKEVGTQLRPVTAAVGDFNADGEQDLAVAYFDSAYVDSVSILTGNGDGTFELGDLYPAGDQIYALAAADLNGDGKLDLAAGHACVGISDPAPEAYCYETPTEVSVLLGGGDGTLGEETRYDSGQSFSLGVGDFDQDGHLDLISSSSTILFGAGDGTFGRARQFAHFGPGGVVDDFNRDGRPDVALAGVIVALNEGTTESSHPPIALAGSDAGLECASPSGAEVLLNGTASSDPDSTPGTSDDIAAFDWFEDYGLTTQQQLGSGETLHLVLPLGLHAITLRVTDRAGVSSTDETSIRVADTVPPQVSVHLTPNMLWPPNHQMVDISAEVTVTDACGQAGVILSSIQSGGQTSASRRSGSTVDDVSGADIGTSDFSFQLRAGRSTSKQGWFYLVTYSATDAAGNQSSATGAVHVYHDRRRSPGADPSP